MTSLTKALLFEKGKPRVEKITVDGMDIWVRSCPPVQLTRREVQCFQDDEEQGRRGLYTIIDQIMEDETTPMFTDEDIEKLEALDAEALTPLSIAITKFNGDSQKKVTGGLNGTSKSLKTTPDSDSQ